MPVLRMKAECFVLCYAGLSEGRDLTLITAAMDRLPFIWLDIIVEMIKKWLRSLLRMGLT